MIEPVDSELAACRHLRAVLAQHPATSEVVLDAFRAALATGAGRYRVCNYLDSGPGNIPADVIRAALRAVERATQ